MFESPIRGVRSISFWFWFYSWSLPGLLHHAVSEVRVTRVHHFQLHACQIQELRAILPVERVFQVP